MVGFNARVEYALVNDSIGNARHNQKRKINLKTVGFQNLCWNINLYYRCAVQLSPGLFAFETS